MFVSWSTYQEALDTIKDLRTQLEDEQRSRRIMREDSEREHKRDNFQQDQAHEAAILAKDNKIATLENQIERMESEMEARLKLQEDIHLDELIAVEAKFEAQKEALEITHKAKEDAMKTQAEAASSRAYAERDKILAAAEREGTEIIQKALENVQVIYQNALSVLASRMKDISTMSSAEITNLIKAATENYPTLPDTLTSTSSSK